MIGIDLFSGAGGMSLGAAEAGVKAALAIEYDRNAAATYKRNHPSVEVLVQDIREISARKIKKVKHGTNGTILFGGPPCQGFSYSNSRTRSVENTDNWLFREFIRVARIWCPDIVILENVQGIANTEGGIFLKEISDALNKLKYKLDIGILNAANFGVPQNRSRLFVVGTRHLSTKCVLPSGTASRNVPVHDALADLPSLENGDYYQRLPYKREAHCAYAKRMRGNLSACGNHLLTKNAEYVIRRYRYIPQGGNWRNIPARLMRNYKNRNDCHTGIYYRLRPDEPSVVIGNFRKNMLIHPEEHRGLSVREAARIQSFPDWYEFTGSIGFQQQQVGNAVPPLLAHAVFRSLVKTVEGGNHDTAK